MGWGTTTLIAITSKRSFIVVLIHKIESISLVFAGGASAARLRDHLQLKRGLPTASQWWLYQRIYVWVIPSWASSSSHRRVTWLVPSSWMPQILLMGAQRREAWEEGRSWVPELLHHPFLQDASGAFKLKVFKMSLCLMGMEVHQPNWSGLASY